MKIKYWYAYMCLKYKFAQKNVPYEAAMKCSIRVWE